MQCPKCYAEAGVKNGFVKGVQRYKCKNCGCQYTRPTPHGQPIQTKIFALLLYLSGVSMNMTGRIIGVTGQSVMRWIKAYDLACKQEQLAEIVEKIEIDEMHHFVGKNKGFFGCGKYLVIPLGGFLDGNVAIAVRLPLKNFTTDQDYGRQNVSIPTDIKPIVK